MVTLRFKDELKDLLTDTGTRVISDNNLPRLVRQLVVHINVSEHILHSLSVNYWYLLQIRPSFWFSHFIFVMVLVFFLPGDFSCDIAVYTLDSSVVGSRGSD